MHGFFRETPFGRIVNAISGDRLFRQEEALNPALLEPYSKDRKPPSETSSGHEDQNALRLEKTITDPESGKDHQLVDWLENDPEKPRNWSTPKKFFVTFQICFLTTGVYIGSAIYTSGIQGVEEQFGVSEVVAVLGLTLFVLGYAIGPMFLAVLCEVPFFGRNPVFMITLFLFVILQFAVIYAKNIGMLLAFRFITGFIGSPVLAVGGAVIADLYKPSKQAYGIAIWGISAVCGPALGPVVGGFAAEAKGWTWTIWELMWLSGFVCIFLFFLLPETSSSNIIFRRAGRYRKATGNDDLRCEAEIEAAQMKGGDALKLIFVQPFVLAFLEPICFLLNLYIALIYALLYLWFESFPIVFAGIYGFSQGIEGLVFVGILVGALVVIGPFCFYVHHYIEPQFNENGEIQPEKRLPAAFVGAFFIPACLFIFGWTARADVPWIAPIIGTALFPIGAFLLFMSVLSYLGDAYPKHVGAVYAGNDLVRSCFGAGFPLFATAMYNKLGVGWASSLLGFLSVLFIPIPFVLYKYGKQIRQRSKLARHDL